MTDTPGTSQEEATASAAVLEEFQTLVQFRPQFSPKEAVGLRRYAWRRCAFPRPVDHLSETEAAWRRLFEALDEQLKASLSPELKAKIDDLDYREANLKIAKRMLDFRMQHEPKEHPIGAFIFYAILAAGCAVAWFFHSWTDLFITIGAAVSAAFACAVVFRDTWSSSHVAHWLNLFARVTHAETLRSAAARLVESNVLRAGEYEMSGDPKRAAESVKTLDAILQQQETAIATAAGLFQSEPFKEAIRPAEDKMLDSAATAAERLRQAQHVVATIKSFEEHLLPPVDEANDATEEELFDAERQFSGLAEGPKRQKLQQWLRTAKLEYLHGRIATNIVRNWFEFEACNANAVSEHEGNIDFKIDAKDFAAKAAEIQILPEIKRERDEYRSARTTLQKELLGILA